MFDWVRIDLDSCLYALAAFGGFSLLVFVLVFALDHFLPKGNHHE